MANVIGLAKETGVRHVVCLTAFGTNETRKFMSFWFRWIIDSSKIGVTYQDHERQEDLLRASDLDWTIVRPVGLTNEVEEQEVLIIRPDGPKPALTISRKAVAGFLLDAAEKHHFVGEAVGISEKK